MKQSLIVDGQILQTSAWYRGMGKYTVQLLREISSNSPTTLNIYIVFNTAIETDPLRYKTIKLICPKINLLFADLPITSDKGATPQQYKESLYRCIEENVQESRKFFMLAALFTFDFFAEYPQGCQRLLLFYDLTPLLFWKDLGGYFPPHQYMKRFEQILDSDHIFSISETTKSDLVTVFGLETSRITNINGGFTKIAETNKKPTSFEVPNKYVLFPTGDLPHKNNETAVQGYQKYINKAENGNKLPLLITSHFSDKSRRRLHRLSPNIVFTGNVLDEELEWMYENAEAILFASKYEGLGLPILDAIASNKPVITSRIPVFEEMTKQAFYYYDPESSDDLANAIEKALNREDFTHKLQDYSKVIDKYTWKNTSSGVLSYLSKKPTRVLGNRGHKANPLLKLAVVGIHPGVKGQIGRLAEPLYASLRTRFNIDFFFDANGLHSREMERPSFLDNLECTVYDIGNLNFQTYRNYDLILYLIDDSAIPSRAVQRSCVLPGVVVYDFNSRLEKNHQTKLIKELVFTNQVTLIKVTKPKYDFYRKLTDDLADLVEGESIIHPARAIIKSGGSNNKIMRRLLALGKTNVS